MEPWTQNFTIDIIHGLGFWGSIGFLLKEIGMETCKDIFKTDAAKMLIKSRKKYDLLITEIFGTDCFLGYAHHFKIPSVLLTTSVNLPWSGDRIGLPDNPSYIPNYMVPYSTEMSFFERMKNTFVVLITNFMFDYFSTIRSNEIAKEYFGEDLPDLRDLAKNVSLLLANSHLSVNFARPSVPNFIEVGGLHLKKPKPVPKNLESILTTKTRGVIYVGMGSYAKIESFAFEKLQAMFDTFEEVAYTVLIKARKEDLNSSLRIPGNVHFKEWVPQFDVLCHPNVKLFVSHGGALGGQEAVYCGVPRLGVPLVADQESIIRASERKGVALRLDYHEITKESFSKAVNKLLFDESYMRNTENIAKIFKDRPLSALDTALYWIEYVITHNGAPHLRITGADLPWYKYFLIDVIATGVIGVFILIWVIYKSVKAVFSLKKGETVVRLGNKKNQ